MQPPDNFNPEIGRAETIAPGLRRIVAPNPSAMTYRGTNTYLLGESDLAVIDPGPDDEAHLAAILAAVGSDQRISHIIVTHSHADHAPLARPLSAATKAPVLAYGDAQAGRSVAMIALAESGLVGGGEGIDAGFAPDINLADREVVTGTGWSLRTLWTPGHLGNHISLIWNDCVFTGDHVMGWATSLVSPPDGDLTQFMASCRALQAVPARRYFPGHGDVVENPAERLEWLIRHRLSREASILDALSDGPTTAAQLAARIYTETPPALQGAATRNVLAHLIDLTARNRVAPEGPLAADTVFARAPEGK